MLYKKFSIMLFYRIVFLSLSLFFHLILLFYSYFFYYLKAKRISNKYFEKNFIFLSSFLILILFFLLFESQKIINKYFEEKNQFCFMLFLNFDVIKTFLILLFYKIVFHNLSFNSLSIFFFSVLFCLNNVTIIVYQSFLNLNFSFF